MDQRTVRDALQAAHDLIFESFTLLGEPDETIELIEDALQSLDAGTDDFDCPSPDCGGGVLEQVLVDATIETPFLRFERGRGEYDRSRARITDGTIDRYQCRECGYVPTIDGQPLTDEERLSEYLQNQDDFEA